MIKNIVFFLTFGMVLLYPSCNSNESATKLLPEEMLVDILVDLHVSESSLLHFAPSNKDSVQSLYLTEILKIYEISKQDLDRTLNYLYDNPEYNLEVMKQVLSKIDSIEQIHQVN